MSIIDFLAWVRQRLVALGPTEPTAGGGAATAAAPGTEAEGAAEAGGQEAEGDEEPEGAEAGASDGGADPSNASGDGEGGASAEQDAESQAEGSDAGATEADEGAGVAAATIRSAVDAKLAALKAQGLGTLKQPRFDFKPDVKITSEMLAEYNRLVDSDKPGEAMLFLMSEGLAQGISQAFQAYHRNIVHPLTTQAAQNARDARNNRRTAEWESSHPAEAKDVELKKEMIRLYNQYADKEGVLAADEITLDELMLMARAKVPARKGKNGKAEQTTEETDADDKSRRLAARAPGAVARLRTGKGTDKGGSPNAGAKNPYLDHLKSHRTTPF